MYLQLRLMWISLERGMDVLELVAWHTNFLPRSSLYTHTHILSSDSKALQILKSLI
jgi:hypothetical protein